MDTGLNIYDITAAELKKPRITSIFFKEILFTPEQATAIVALIKGTST